MKTKHHRATDTGKSLSSAASALVSHRAGLVVLVILGSVYVLNLLFHWGRGSLNDVKWLVHGSDNYRATFSSDIPGTAGLREIVTVSSGAIVAREFPDCTRDDCAPPNGMDPRTIQSFSDDAKWCALLFPLMTCSVEYDDYYGYPKQIDFTCLVMRDRCAKTARLEHVELLDEASARSQATLRSKPRITRSGHSDLNPIDPQALAPPYGKIVFEARLAFDDDELFSIDADGGNLSRLTYEPGFDQHAVWSPDGSRIAFVSTRFDNWEICIMDADGGNVRRVTDDSASDINPSWSPDGTKLVFQSDRDTRRITYGDVRDRSGVYQLYVVKADGSDVRRITNDPSTNDWHPSWSPDGSQIIFESQPGFDLNRIEVVDPYGNNRRVLASDSVFSYSQPNWSPDGQQIAFVEARDDVPTILTNILVMDADGQNVGPINERLTPGRSPRWSPDGQHIVFSSSDYGWATDTIYIMNSDGSGVTPLVDMPYDTRTPHWSPE